jgi:hypothetical protein
MRYGTRYVVAALALSAVACGSSAAKRPASPATAPDPAREQAHADPGARSAEAPETPTKLMSWFQTEEEDVNSLPPGIYITDLGSRGRPTPVRPTGIDLASLPLGEIPKPLLHDEAPKSLPNGRRSSEIKIEQVNAHSRSRSNAVYVVLGAKMGRIQVGNVNSSLNAGDRVYRTCGEQYYKQPMLTPARWETFAVDGKGHAEYRVTDAWFDGMSCETAVIRTTVIRPKPLLGGLVYGFQTKCDDCPSKRTVTFIAPTVSQIAANGVGGQATASHGSAMSLITLPVRRGGAASFTGTVHFHNLKRWLEATNQESPAADVTVGVEISQAVGDDAPQAITYATFIKHQNVQKSKNPAPPQVISPSIPRAPVNGF